MDLAALAGLSPALGSVAVLGYVIVQGIKAFKSLTEALHANEKAIDALCKNVDKNTEVTERISQLFDRQYDYLSRKSPAHQ